MLMLNVDFVKYQSVFKPRRTPRERRSPGVDMEGNYALYPRLASTVERNKAYPRSNSSIRERNNERKYEIYSNPDIVQKRSHFKIEAEKQCIV